MPLVYLAGPIENVTPAEASGWRVRANFLLSQKRLGVYTLDPLRGKYGPNGSILTTPLGVVTRDRNDVRRCQVVLANLLLGPFSIGTVAEIAWADAYRKPVVGIVSEELIHPFLKQLVHYQAATLEEAIQVVLEII